jgi:5-methyltetrahydrofolate--homocysteine methyltransferase
MSREQEIRQFLFDHTLAGRAKEVKELTEEALSIGMKPTTLLFETLIPALKEVGRRFETGEYFVPEMLVAAKATQQALTILRPALSVAGMAPSGAVMMMTVKGDLHDIGKNLCNIMFEGAGFRVIDLGVNVPPEKMIAAIRQHQPDVVGFSALLTTTMPMFKTNLDALVKAGLRDQVKVIVGGAPVTQGYADQIGADGYAADAGAAVRLVQRLLPVAALQP